MVFIALPLQAVLELRLCLEDGQSLSESIRYLNKKHSNNSFLQELQHWLFAKETGQASCFDFSDKPYRQALVDILERGLTGEPMLEHLKVLEKDLCKAAEDDLERHIQKLPLLSLIPVMLFQFPAFILLLLGPLLLDLLASF